MMVVFLFCPAECNRRRVTPEGSLEYTTSVISLSSCCFRPTIHGNAIVSTTVNAKHRLVACRTNCLQINEAVANSAENEKLSYLHD